MVNFSNAAKILNNGYGDEPKMNSNIIVAVDGLGAIDLDANPTKVNSGNYIFAPYRWIHNKHAGALYGSMNVLCVDEHAVTAKVGAVFSGSSPGPAFDAASNNLNSYIYYVK